jgi:hypothetical protein
MFSSQGESRSGGSLQTKEFAFHCNSAEANNLSDFLFRGYAASFYAAQIPAKILRQCHSWQGDSFWAARAISSVVD